MNILLKLEIKILNNKSDVIIAKITGKTKGGSPDIPEYNKIKKEILNKCKNQKVIIDMTDLEYVWGDWPAVLCVELSGNGINYSFIASGKVAESLNNLLSDSKLKQTFNLKIYSSVDKACEDFRH